MAHRFSLHLISALNLLPLSAENKKGRAFIRSLAYLTRPLNINLWITEFVFKEGGEVSNPGNLGGGRGELLLTSAKSAFEEMQDAILPSYEPGTICKIPPLNGPSCQTKKPVLKNRFPSLLLKGSVLSGSFIYVSQ